MEKTKEEKRMDWLVQIASGLLASGHYTLKPGGEDNTPELITFCVGKDYKEDGFTKRHQLSVAHDAESIMTDLEKIANNLPL